MYLRTVLIVFALAILALFTAVNWSAFKHTDDCFADLCQR